MTQARRTWHRGVFEAMDRPGLRWLLGLLATARQSVRGRGLCRVSYRNGYWVHSFSDGKIAADQIGTTSPSKLDADTRDTFLFEYVPKVGDVIVDVGAGEGTETATFSRVAGPNGRVIAIEAHPRTFARLQQLVQLNSLNNVSCMQLAISDKRGALHMTDVADHATNRLLAAGAQGGVDVPTLSLDDLVREQKIDRIDFLKMNIEGAERTAFAAMTHTLAITHHLAISCHDFLAERGTDGDYRTKNIVKPALESAGFEVLTRPDDSRDWVRDYLYARRK
jgi:FkbM family methyltransferase